MLQSLGPKCETTSALDEFLNTAVIENTSFGSSSDVEITVLYNRVLVILSLKRPRLGKLDVSVQAEPLRKLDDAAIDPDDLTLDLCLEEVHDLVLATCRESIQGLAPPIHRKGDQPSQTLDEWLHPETYCFELVPVHCELSAVTRKNTAVDGQRTIISFFHLSSMFQRTK